MACSPRSCHEPIRPDRRIRPPGAAGCSPVGPGPPVQVRIQSSRPITVTVTVAAGTQAGGTAGREPPRRRARLTGRTVSATVT